MTGGGVVPFTLEALNAEISRRKIREHWQQQARPPQLPPEGDWRVWYVRGGRGAGKTRTGAETLADWILGSEPGEWAIVAPTFGDARSVCAEGGSGLLQALGGTQGFVENYNRSEGVIRVTNGASVLLDGANDGAYRVQGHNLRGAWADEVGLWENWQESWHESIAFAVRMPPSRIVATGTPKMAHPLIAHLLASEHVVETHMRTLDNIENLSEAAVDELRAQYEGSTLGRQELEGEFIEALDGEILPRHAWRYFASRGVPVDAVAAARLPRFEQIIHSWDTAVKGKASNDPVAGQVWGCTGPDRYLLDIYHGRLTLDGTIEAMLRLLRTARERWPNVPQKVLIETAANGADAIREMRRRVDGIYGYNPRDGGDKVRRALTAAPALETGHCFLPGFPDPDPDGRGYAVDTPPLVQAFVEECAQFGPEGAKHGVHDDQVDAWSQMVNWSRGNVRKRASIGQAKGALPRPGSLVPVGHGQGL